LEEGVTTEPKENPGISSPSSEPKTPSPNEEPSTEADYILNTNTKKFHYPSCSSVDEMKEKNKKEYVGSRDDLIAQGYSPCGRCKP
jgi:DNA-entry nuclease